jgi:hypothetical protein
MMPGDQWVMGYIVEAGSQDCKEGPENGVGEE